MFRHQRHIGGLIILTGVLFFASRNFLVGLVEGLLLVFIGWASWLHRRDASQRVPPLLAMVTGFVAMGACVFVLVARR